MNKKGSTSDAVVWLVMLVMMAILFPIGLMLMDNLNDGIQEQQIGSTESLSQVQNFTDRFPSLFDGIFVFLFMGMLIATLLFALFIDSNPALFFVGIVVVVIVLVLAAMLGNTVDHWINSPVISGYTSQFPMTSFIWNNIVFIVITWIVVVGVVIWAKVK